MPNHEISFQGKVTKDIFIAAQKLYASTFAYTYLAAGIVMIAIFGFQQFYLGENSWWGSVIGICLIGLYLYLLNTQRKAGELYHQDKALQLPFLGTINSEGYMSETDLGTVTIPWNLCLFYKANDQLILVFKNPCLFHIFARDFFKNDVEWQGVLEIITSHLPEQKEYLHKDRFPGATSETRS